MDSIDLPIIPKSSFCCNTSSQTRKQIWCYLYLVCIRSALFKSTILSQHSRPPGTCTDPACSQFPNRRAAGHLPKSSPGVLPVLEGPEWSAELLVQQGLPPLVFCDRQLVQLWCLLVSFGRQFLLWCPWEPSRQFQQCPPPLLQTSHWTSWTIFRTISQGSGKDSPTMTKRFLTNFELSKRKLPESVEWVT